VGVVGPHISDRRLLTQLETVGGAERHASGRPEWVRAPYVYRLWLWWVFPSSAGPVKSRVNLPGPPGKAEYSLVTDSARVP
jgi:hypothetical protein